MSDQERVCGECAELTRCEGSRKLPYQAGVKLGRCCPRGLVFEGDPACDHFRGRDGRDGPDGV